MKHIKEKILEIAEIVKTCPENLQAVCFETLLKHYLASIATENKATDTKTHKELKPEQAVAAVEATTKKQDDLKESDLHLKVKRFMEKEGVSIIALNNLFYKEGDKVLPLFDDLKTTRMSESQMRIALLHSLINAFSTGEFQASVDAVRAECSERKCYDSANFAATFKNNKTLFDFAKFDRDTKFVRLSESGRKELADVIKELQ